MSASGILINSKKNNFFTNKLSINAWQGIFLRFIESILIGLYYFLPLYFVNELKISIAMSGIIISFYGIGTIFGGLIGGILSDKFSSNHVCLFSIFLQAIVFFFFMQFKSAHLLMINLFLLGIASYSFITANYLWILGFCEIEHEKLNAINFTNMAANLGLGISGIIIGFLVKKGFEKIFLLFFIILLSMSFYFIFKCRNQKLKNQKLSLKNDLSSNKVNHNSKSIFLALICLFLSGLIISQLNSTYGLYLQFKFPALGTHALGIFFAINTFSVILFQAVLVNLFRKFNKILIMGIGGFLLGIGMFVLPFSLFFITTVFACLIYTMGEILFFSMSQFICYQYGCQQKKGQIMGWYRAVFASSRFVGPSLGSFIYQGFGPPFLWYGCGMIGLICFVFCWCNRKIL